MNVEILSQLYQTFWPMFTTFAQLPIYFIYNSVSIYWTKFISYCPSWQAVSIPLLYDSSVNILFFLFHLLDVISITVQVESAVFVHSLLISECHVISDNSLSNSQMKGINFSVPYYKFVYIICEINYLEKAIFKSNAVCLS